MELVGIIALFMALSATATETVTKDSKTLTWIKAHGLNLAVALDILSAQSKELRNENFRLEDIPVWVPAVLVLLLISTLAKHYKVRRAAQAAAVITTVVESL